MADCPTATAPSSEEEDEDESEEEEDDEEDDDGIAALFEDRRPALGGIAGTDIGPKVLLRSASLFRRSGLLSRKDKGVSWPVRACVLRLAVRSERRERRLGTRVGARQGACGLVASV